LPEAPDSNWESEVKRRGGHVSEVDRRIAQSPWLREAALSLTTYQVVAMPQRLFHIGAMVTAQENACRYCYGANRAYLKILGYSEDFIHRIERDVHVAELDEKERAAIAFCRNLARSRPRPSREACDKLVNLGYSRLAVNEIAFAISMGCFYNRLSTFMACPPERGFERMANGPLGRIMGLAMPLLSWFKRSVSTAARASALDAQALAPSRFAPILLPLAGLPAARIMRDALEGIFASNVLGRATKALMFATVARTMGCTLCETWATDMLLEDGMPAQEIASALAHLQSDRLPASEAGLLPWTRGTVYYDIAKIQQDTRQLGAAIGERALLEAIGVAALANATVRLAMLHE
ncbi:MAG: carboxymuconolactone decarboxylase family protein, partial [Betaproteobacteria bacterium]